MKKQVTTTWCLLQTHRHSFYIGRRQRGRHKYSVQMQRNKIKYRSCENRFYVKNFRSDIEVILHWQHRLIINRIWQLQTILSILGIVSPFSIFITFPLKDIVFLYRKCTEYYRNVYFWCESYKNGEWTNKWNNPIKQVFLITPHTALRESQPIVCIDHRFFFSISLISPRIMWSNPNMLLQW